MKTFWMGSLPVWAPRVWTCLGTIDMIVAQMLRAFFTKQNGRRFNQFLRKNRLDFSGILTGIVRVEGEQTDHKTIGH